MNLNLDIDEKWSYSIGILDSLIITHRFYKKDLYIQGDKNFAKRLKQSDFWALNACPAKWSWDFLKSPNFARVHTLILYFHLLYSCTCAESRIDELFDTQYSPHACKHYISSAFKRLNAYSGSFFSLRSAKWWRKKIDFIKNDRFHVFFFWSLFADHREPRFHPKMVEISIEFKRVFENFCLLGQ